MNMADNVNDDELPLSELAVKEWVRIEKKKRKNEEILKRRHAKEGETDDGEKPKFVLLYELENMNLRMYWIYIQY